MIIGALKDSIFFYTYLKIMSFVSCGCAVFFQTMFTRTIIRFSFSVSQILGRQRYVLSAALRHFGSNIQNNIKLEKKVFMKKSPEKILLMNIFCCGDNIHHSVNNNKCCN